jgi:hypothetical protein
VSREPHSGWNRDDRSGMDYLVVPNPAGKKLYVVHPMLDGSQYRWIDGIVGVSGEAPTAHAAKVAVEQNLVEHLRKMLAFMGAS